MARSCEDDGRKPCTETITENETRISGRPKDETLGVSGWDILTADMSGWRNMLEGQDLQWAD